MKITPIEMLNMVITTIRKEKDNHSQVDQNPSISYSQTHSPPYFMPPYSSGTRFSSYEPRTLASLIVSEMVAFLPTRSFIICIASTPSMIQGTFLFQYQSHRSTTSHPDTVHATVCHTFQCIPCNSWYPRFEPMCSRSLSCSWTCWYRLAHTPSAYYSSLSSPFHTGPASCRFESGSYQPYRTRCLVHPRKWECPSNSR